MVTIMYVVTFFEWVGGSRLLCRDVLSGWVKTIMW